MDEARNTLPETSDAAKALFPPSVVTAMMRTQQNLKIDIKDA